MGIAATFSFLRVNIVYDNCFENNGIKLKSRMCHRERVARQSSAFIRKQQWGLLRRSAPRNDMLQRESFDDIGFENSFVGADSIRAMGIAATFSCLVV